MINPVLLTKEEKNLRVQIQNKSSLSVKIVLLLLFIPCTLLPIIGIILAANSGKLNFGLLFATVLFSALLVYPFLKVILWQFYGREIFTIRKNEISYEANFKFLKSQYETIETGQLEILFSDRELQNDQKIGTLVFISGENKLKSVLKINETDYQQIQEEYHTLILNT